MIWDACLARAVAGELTERLAGLRLRALLLQRESRQAVVYFRELVVVVDLWPGRGFVVVEQAEEPGLEAEPLAAVFVRAEAVADERTMLMKFRRVRGGRPDPLLVVDFSANRWNVLLAEEPSLVVRSRLVATKARSQRIGRRWTAPEGGRRAGPAGSAGAAGGNRQRAAAGQVDLRAWVEMTGDGGDGGDERRLLSGAAYASRLNAAHLLGAPTAEDGLARWAAMARMEGVAPHVLHHVDGPQPYPWPLSGVDAAPAPTLLDAMRQASAEVARSGATGRAAQLIEAEIARLSRKVERLREELDGAAEAGRLREDATLILSSLHAIPRNAARVELLGFDGNSRILRLNPAARPQDQANALFRRAARLERAAPGLACALRAAEDEWARAEAVRRRHLETGLSREEVAALEKAARRARPARHAVALPYRTYRSSGGLEIRVGRGPRRNDDLTFRHSRPNDIWLHARHSAGAHVVLRWNRPERPPATDLNQAAVLAANHSRARGAGQAPVDWTRRKWVRKPRGSAPGVVAPERVETVFAVPDPELEGRLAPVRAGAHDRFADRSALRR